VALILSGFINILRQYRKILSTCYDKKKKLEPSLVTRRLTNVSERREQIPDSLSGLWRPESRQASTPVHSGRIYGILGSGKCLILIFFRSLIVFLLTVSDYELKLDLMLDPK
jgi:Flp pilus assembly protein TadB